jgi:hypothetical protein
MVQSSIKRLAELDCHPAIKKCALTREDIDTYHLPPNRTKEKDSRSAAHIVKYGDISVELDALPPQVLRDRLVQEVEARMDLHMLYAVREQEEEERNYLATMLGRGA